MSRLGSVLLATALVGGLLVAFAALPPLPLVDTGSYDRATVTVQSAEGNQTVDVRIADTAAKRQIGLSRTDRLENGTGMLFVHAETGEKSYVMRNMSVGIDIIFVDAGGTITEIYSARPPPNDDPPYTGRGLYVLEVPRGWADTTGVAVGDTLTIPASARERVSP